MPFLRLVSRITAALVALLSALVIGLSVGAAWMVLGAYLNRELVWLVLPVGLVIGLIMRGVTRSHIEAGILAALGTGFAAVYVNMLMGAMQIAGTLGLSFAYALRQAGPGMLYDLTWMSFSPQRWLLVAAGMTLAAYAAVRARHARVS